MKEPDPGRLRALILCAFEVALRAEAATGTAPSPDLRWLITRFSLNTPGVAARLPRVMGVLDPDVAGTVRRLALASRDQSQASQTLDIPGSQLGTVVETSPGTEGVVRVGVSEAARVLGVSDHAVRAACRRKALPAVKDEHGAWLIAVADLEVRARGRTRAGEADQRRAHGDPPGREARRDQPAPGTVLGAGDRRRTR